MSIRTARPADFEAVAQLWNDAYIADGHVRRPEPFVAEDVTRAVASGSLRLFELEGRVAGSVLLARHGSPMANLTAMAEEMQVCLLAVLPAARRLGIARTLMEDCRRTAAAEHCRALLLWTRPTQTSAHRLYESLGYLHTPVLDPSADPQPRLAYRLALF